MGVGVLTQVPAWVRRFRKETRFRDTLQEKRKKELGQEEKFIRNIMLLVMALVALVLTVPILMDLLERLP